MGKQQKQPATQTVVNKTELPAWVDQAAQGNLAQANLTADNLMAPYTGSTVAPYNQQQADAWRLAEGALGAGQPAMNAAQTALMGLTGGSAPRVTAQTVNGTNVTAGQFSAEALTPYLNPYTQQVVDAGLSDLERQRQASITQTGDQAAAAGAFGGSRQAIREAVTNSESARAAGALSAQLRSDAFTKAAGLLASDQDRTLTADRSNQATDLAAKQGNQNAALEASKANATNATEARKVGILGATHLGALGQQQMDAVLKQASVNEGIGDRLQGQDAAQRAEAAAQYNAQRNYPVEQLNLKMQALGMTPYGQSQSTTGPSTQQAGNPLLGALGGAATGASIASTLGLTGAGAYGGAGMGGLMGLLAMSDENEKTDIKRVGKDPKTGLPLYSYRYKGDPKTYPKVVGPMAQDVEKVAPEAVKTVPGTGRKAVAASFLGAVMPAPAANVPRSAPVPKLAGKGKRPARGGFLSGRL